MWSNLQDIFDKVNLRTWAENFRVPMEDLKRFLERQSLVQNRAWAKSFLDHEYGENIPSGKQVAVVLPKNTPHLWIQELWLANVGGYEAVFVPSREIFAWISELGRTLDFKVADSLDGFEEIRTYGREALGLGSRECFHGPWYMGMPVENLDTAKKELMFLNGRGCLTPVMLIADRDLELVIKPQLDTPPGVGVWLQTLRGVQKIYGGSTYGLIADVRRWTLDQVFDVIRNINSPGFGACYQITEKQWLGLLKTESRFIEMPKNVLGFDLTTIPERANFNG